ncbi:50S ribosomal protein L28 [Kineococcus indalonis]|uniref:50S ribosomal protein L28 n=1 Tax=Kineococcus indalonis TaxID=2696566 RepID=UPI001413003C|nr:50S ribosomal protein L28 [Kineococcus indalonis]NAZ88039.1 50S ribosomal protein L28 [Kineococcus indalonis]
MPARCQVIGAVPGFGKTVSHSHRRTSRRFDPNVQRKKRFVPSRGRTVTLTVSARGTKTVDRRGIEAVVADLRRRGERFRWPGPGTCAR